MAQIIAEDNNENQAPPAWARMSRNGLIAGVLALVGLLFGSIMGLAGGSASLGFQAYMYGWIFWMAVTFGCFIFHLLINITRATWGFPVVRLFEAGAKMLPFMGILFLPIGINVLMGKASIYPWADYSAVMHDAKMLNRYMFMNPAGWWLRNLFYFASWSAITYILSRLSAEQDRTRNAALIQKRVDMASISFLYMGVTGTFAYVDWVMSLDPHWYSTIYAAWFMVGAALTAISFVSIVATSLRLQGRNPYLALVTPKVTRDWGNLMLMLCMVWAYFSLSQFLITWAGNLPEEITYYLARNNGTTAYVTTFLVMAMFFTPFLCLLSGKTKRYPTLLRSVAIWIFSVRILEAFWNIVPFYARNYTTPLLQQVNPAYLWAIIGIGGLWMFGFFRFAQRNVLLVPIEDLIVGEEIAHAA